MAAVEAAGYTTPTPIHASWLNMAEIELSALSRQCLHRRLSSIEDVEREISACVNERNAHQIAISWRFTTPKARETLKRHYASIKN